MKLYPSDNTEENVGITGAERPLNLLQRVFVPIEKRTAKGTWVFKTHDNQVYARLDDGSIRRATQKVRGKAARRADKERRRHADTNTAQSAQLADAALDRADQSADQPGHAATAKTIKGDTYMGASDPRTDRHPDDGTPGKFPDPPDNSQPFPAPGGAGNPSQPKPEPPPTAPKP